MSPAVRVDELGGWTSVTLLSPAIEVVVLPDKGADVVSLIDRRSGVDVLFHAPWGLQPPGAPPRDGWGGHDFLANYEGGWQELLPNTNDPCEVDGRSHPFHGDIATRPWDWESSTATDAAELRLSVETVNATLRLTRLMRVVNDEARLIVEETVTNVGDRDQQFVWGHHLVLGAPLIGDGAVFDVDCSTVATPSDVWEGTARLEPAQRSAWPRARLRAGGDVDLSRLPGPEQGSHDDVYLTGLREGRATVWNPALELGFQLEFDASLFQWLISWQPFGGALDLPLAGSYGLGVEPWVAGGNLAAAVAEGAALALTPGASLTTTLIASLLHEAPTSASR